MSDIQEPTGWNNPETASAYGQFASESPLYRETSTDLVEFAQIESGMSIVDLACGTGETTKAILRKLGDAGLVYAVDMSQAMLEEAQRRVEDPRVHFIKSLSVNSDQAVGVKVNRVISNSAFWQFRLDPALKSIANLLKDDGKLAFNIPGQFFQFEPGEVIPPDFHLSQRFLLLASRKFKIEVPMGIKGVVMLNQSLIVEKLKQNNFVLEQREIKVYQNTIADVYQWLKIPMMTESLLPEISYPHRMEVLDSAYSQMDPKTKTTQQWVNFRVRKK